MLFKVSKYCVTKRLGFCNLQAKAMKSGFPFTHKGNEVYDVSYYFPIRHIQIEMSH